MHVEIKTTADGSQTLFVPELNEHYHSMNGAVQESKYVFIRMGLHVCETVEIKILEIGFGTGLNALLTLRETGTERNVLYHAVELFPLPWDLVESLKYSRYLDLKEDLSFSFREMHMADWETETWIQPQFCLRKIRASIIGTELPASYNLIYFDTFAPSVQPELWTEAVFRKMFNALDKGGLLVTYCAKGEVRRCMKRVGFSVERLPGAPGKREMLRARKVNS
jgi:tRNA U34 5-methylaminomethyl-2-thiouridine-forming methyltransferase MnmC